MARRGMRASSLKVVAGREFDCALSQQVDWPNDPDLRPSDGCLACGLDSSIERSRVAASHPAARRFATRRARDQPRRALLHGIAGGRHDLGRRREWRLCAGARSRRCGPCRRRGRGTRSVPVGRRWRHRHGMGLPSVRGARSHLSLRAGRLRQRRCRHPTSGVLHGLVRTVPVSSPDRRRGLAFGTKRC